MKKIIITLFTSLTININFADYMAKVPLELNQGGGMPNGSIIFINNQTEIVKVLDCINNPTEDSEECEKRLNAWEIFADDRGLSKNWSNLGWGFNWLNNLPKDPYPSTTATTINLEGNQLENVDSLINLTNVTDVFLSSNNLTNIDGLSNINNSNLRIDIQFNRLTNLNGLNNINNLRSLIAFSNELTNIDGLSNLNNVTDRILLDNNKLTNIDGLSNLNSVFLISFENNLITDVDGLSNLNNVDYLYIQSNKLNNVDGLSNINRLKVINISDNPTLENINGLSNMIVDTVINIDSSYSGPKLSYSTVFCTENDYDKFHWQGLQKEEICE